MTAPMLTSGAVKALNNDNRDEILEDPILQILNFTISQNSDASRYRVLLSDGENYIQGILSSNHASLVAEGQLARHSIIRLKESVTKNIRGRSLVIIMDFEVINKDVAERFGAPVAMETLKEPSSELQDTTFVPIVRLNPYQNRWVIKARVTQKTDIKHWKNSRSNGKLFSVNLLDQSGEIKATIYNEEVDRLYNVFEEGKVYSISKARVAMARKQFSILDNEYELSLEANTKVELCNNQSTIPEMKFNSVPISELDNYAKNALVDCICVVVDDSGIQDIVAKSSGKLMRKRDLVCVDDSEMQVCVTLWEKAAEEFDSTDNPVVAFKGLCVNHFNGRSLSLSRGGTLKVNPDIPEASHLRRWYSTQGSSTSYASFNQQSKIRGSSVSTQKMTLNRVKEEITGSGNQGEFFATRATIVSVKHENIAYPGCPECRKKVVQESDNSWRCERCNKVYPEPTWRYLLTVGILDSTCQLYVQVFDEVATQLIGKPANEAMYLKDTDSDAYFMLMKDALFKMYNFKGKAKTQSYMDLTRTQYTIFDAKPISFEEDANSLVNALENITV